MSVTQYLNTFGNQLANDSKKELQRQGKNASNRLSKSLDYKINVSKNSFQFDFLMEDYGDFIDKGVKGIGGVKADGTQWKKKRVTNNKYIYRSPSKTNSRGAFKLSLGGWTIKRGIAPRSKTGQFTSRKGLIFAVRKSIFHTGLETTNFYSKPFEKAFRTFPDEFVEAYGLEVDSLLETALA